MVAKHSNATGKVFPQCGLKTAVKKFGKPAEEAGMKEEKQLHDVMVAHAPEQANTRRMQTSN